MKQAQNLKIVRECLKNLYSIKLKFLKEIDEFLDSSKLPKLSQENSTT